MNEVFADTFYWLALLNPHDAHHQEALDAQPDARLVTTWAVLIEVMDALCERRSRQLAFRFWQETSTDPELIVIPLDEEALHRAAVMFASHADKDWSMTDCLSFIVMQDRDISDALTGDHHFKQAGFQRLLTS